MSLFEIVPFNCRLRIYRRQASSTMRFRPCIDIHAGEVKQIVGSTLTDAEGVGPVTNFVASQSAGDFARMYKKDGLVGGHVIMLGASEANTNAALDALQSYPGGLQVGGGINADNCQFFVEKGASHVIVTSYVFRDGQIDFERLEKLKQLIGKEHLVLDLSCRKKVEDNKFYVMTDRWQKFTTTSIDEALFHRLAEYCDEFLVHAVDVEGKRCGIQQELVELLAKWSPLPVTYAGGASSLDDLDFVERIGSGKVDLSIGSALDIFGGDIRYEDVVAWDKKRGEN
ncbi:phosphoribosylformimino-5-aminoimidazole carboxamide ribotide isomerase, variant [Phytophthora nicotianae CJ01A1]|uniref:1-(5-phosphoribosyl)-5-[(5-phosphoribosylamino)methylideneamino]imidazole-4-carboxamideisomerase n=6 Tax=Phytophthora nicotianae TaxID=4792 RepID=W2PYY0_PHYN3|nr:phosphoribosylformimino-5-aminoimidazole carboxamide ribotide isomerase, variant [Phytophthora nicotianae INRA-310]ETI42623.1 phosphoribosylformimino-5-aminoimidazole carboxamide ribotide isomerase, variant [Phytophthora nicotianae P1569]ETK82629.1 phosphoribosylformimino-5-aminoimidazole carboxamide ribotide isomerase, variant [Phytophthora nicotianae]ETP12337.1 phosphoribosylformimino-5-aminoimidazole carboxamide ribotide isomerase, variant [Phytophthora nicotianae CJ01A1]ETP40442.1 phosph